ncbi:MAG: hypothetical protein ACLQVI_34065 [Polyangiaceae bacterium]
MSRAPSVIHFRCLDTMGLRDVARVLGSGQAGVRLTGNGLALYRRGSRRGPPPLPPSAQVAETFTEKLVEPRLEAREPEAADARETLAPCVASSTPPEPLEEPAIVEVTLRRPPTIWAVALLTIGITFGTAIARVVTTAAPVSVAAASMAAPEATPAPVAWPCATRLEPTAVVTIPVTEGTPASTGLNADPPADSVPTSPAPLPPRPRSAHRHSAHSATATADAPSPTEQTPARATPPSTTTDADDAQATVAQARDALTDAL